MLCSESQAGAQQRSDDAAALHGSHLPAPPGGGGSQRPLIRDTKEAEQEGRAQVLAVDSSRSGAPLPAPLVGGMTGSKVLCMGYSVPGQGSQALGDKGEDVTSW